jgi:hypothetical protein
LNDANDVVQSTIEPWPGLSRASRSLGVFVEVNTEVWPSMRVNNAALFGGAPHCWAPSVASLRERREQQEARMSLPLAWAEEIGSVA